MVEKAEAGEKVSYLPELRLGDPSLVFVPRKEGGIVFYEPAEIPNWYGTKDVFSVRGREWNLSELKRIDCVFPSFSPGSPGCCLAAKGGFSFEVRKFNHCVGYALNVYKDPLQQGFAGDLWTLEEGGEAEIIKLRLLGKVYVNVFKGEAEGDVVLIPVFGKSFEHPKGILVTASQVLMKDSGRKVQGILEGLCSSAPPKANT